MNDELRHKIESYLGGIMSSEEASAFEAQMKIDPELKAEVELSLQESLNPTKNDGPGAIQDNEDSDEIASSVLGQEAAKFDESPRKVLLRRRVPQLRRKRRRLILVGAAAAVLFAVSTIGLLFPTNQGMEQLYAKYYTTNDLPSVIQRDASSSLLESGVLAFQNGDYADAMAYFENYEASTTEPDVAVYLYKGVTYMEQDQFFKAIEQFELVIDSGSMDASKGFWFKAMAYLKAGDQRNASHVLEDIANHIWYYKHEQAKEILEKLD